MKVITAAAFMVVGFALGFVARPNRTADAITCAVVWDDGLIAAPAGCDTLSLGQLPSWNDMRYVISRIKTMSPATRAR